MDVVFGRGAYLDLVGGVGFSDGGSLRSGGRLESREQVRMEIQMHWVAGDLNRHRSRGNQVQRSSQNVGAVKVYA